MFGGHIKKNKKQKKQLSNKLLFLELYVIFSYVFFCVIQRKISKVEIISSVTNTQKKCLEILI